MRPATFTWSPSTWAAKAGFTIQAWVSEPGTEMPDRKLPGLRPADQAVVGIPCCRIGAEKPRRW